MANPSLSPETMFVATPSLVKIENDRRRKSKREKEKKKKRERENENLSTTKIVQDVNRRFLVFHESISKKEEKKKEKERVNVFLGGSYPNS
jgi:hypothetical protein